MVVSCFLLLQIPSHTIRKMNQKMANEGEIAHVEMTDKASKEMGENLASKVVHGDERVDLTEEDVSFPVSRLLSGLLNS